MTNPRFENKIAISTQQVEGCIFLIRGQKVMLSTDLAILYEVEPRSLVQAVKRNIERFPNDFMFQLTWDETVLLKTKLANSGEKPGNASRSQIVILKRGLNTDFRRAISVI